MAKLIVNPTSSTKREIPLSGIKVSIGRDPSNDVVLPDAMVSRRHAVIEHRGTEYFLRDCNSSNGSLVNGDRVSEHTLHDGDVLAMGTVRLVFREDLYVDPATKIIQHPSAPRLECPSCRAIYFRGDLFCRQCGSGLAMGPPRTICTVCGRAVLLPARFCNACGRLLVRNGLEDKEGGAPLGPPAAQRSSPDLTVPPGKGTSASPLSGSRSAVDSADNPREEPGKDGTPRAVEEASFSRRTVAGLIDGVVVLSGQALLLAPAIFYWTSLDATSEVRFFPILLTLCLGPLALVLGSLYYVFYWGVRGATPGKRLFGLIVQSEDGEEPIGLARAVVRLMGYLASFGAFGIGFLLIAFEGRGLHDRIAGTRVVRRKRG